MGELPDCSPRWSDFTTGLRVLVVDDDSLSLKVVGQLLKSCGFAATCSTSSMQALDMLRSRKSDFDLVLSDVFMPDVDGFKLLEIIGLELNLPVIMMSTSATTDVVFQGVTHGAVDFLIKPVRVEELRNIWQHVYRRKKELVKDSEGEEQKRNGIDTETQDNPGEHVLSSSKKRKMGIDGKGRAEDILPKKPRVTWSAEMHEQFVNAVKKLGIDKAVPKKILEMMNVRGLTRENVASHLQKYRLYLKRMDGMPQRKAQQIKSIPADNSNVTAVSSPPGKTPPAAPACVSKAPGILPPNPNVLAVAPHMGTMLASPAFTGMNMAAMFQPPGLSQLAGMGLGMSGLPAANPCMLPILQQQQHQLAQQLHHFWPEIASRSQPMMGQIHGGQLESTQFGGTLPYSPLGLTQCPNLQDGPSPQSSGEGEGSDHVPSTDLPKEECSTQGSEQTKPIAIGQVPADLPGAGMQPHAPPVLHHPTMNDYQMSSLPQIAQVTSMNLGIDGEAQLGVPANFVHMEGMSEVIPHGYGVGGPASNFSGFQDLCAQGAVEEGKESIAEFLDEMMKGTTTNTQMLQ